MSERDLIKTLYATIDRLVIERNGARVALETNAALVLDLIPERDALAVRVETLETALRAAEDAEAMALRAHNNLTIRHGALVAEVKGTAAHDRFLLRREVESQKKWIENLQAQIARPVPVSGGETTEMSSAVNASHLPRLPEQEGR
jgi:hypothetical protein